VTPVWREVSKRALVLLHDESLSEDGGSIGTREGGSSRTALIDSAVFGHAREGGLRDLFGHVNGPGQTIRLSRKLDGAKLVPFRDGS
jgi:hypothetical protein